MTNSKKLLGWSVALALWPHAAFGAITAPDLILFNGKLFTADPARPTAEAIAVRGDRILAVVSALVPIEARWIIALTPRFQASSSSHSFGP